MSEPRGFHTHADGTSHSHDHSEQHGHTHTHSHTQTKAVLNRLSRALGHLESVKRMVEDGRDCSEGEFCKAELPCAFPRAIGNNVYVQLKNTGTVCITACRPGVLERGLRGAARPCRPARREIGSI